MNRAFLVVGPEASGNRFMTRMLVSCGCYGVGAHQQPMDAPDGGVAITHPHPMIVFCRSYPWGAGVEYWPSIPMLVSQLSEHEYETTVLVMVRDTSVVEKSQVRAGHTAGTDQSWANIKKAYEVIFEGVVQTKVPFYLVEYIHLGRPTYLNWLFDKLGLSPGPLEGWSDGDAKYL